MVSPPHNLAGLSVNQYDRPDVLIKRVRILAIVSGFAGLAGFLSGVGGLPSLIGAIVAVLGFRVRIECNGRVEGG